MVLFSIKDYESSLITFILVLKFRKCNNIFCRKIIISTIVLAKASFPKPINNLCVVSIV